MVDEALRSEVFRRELRGAPAGTAERLRSWAHESAEELAGEAAAEYRALCRTREERTARGRDAGSARRVHRVRGGGLFAALAVLVPLVAAAAAVVFLVLGYVLMLVRAQRDVGASLVVTGWSGAGIAAVTGALGLGRLVVTARRHSRSSPASGPGGTPVLAEDRRAEDRAGKAWRAALLERAVLPYLRARLPDARREVSAGREAPARRSGHHSPDYGTFDYGSFDYGSFDFASPDYAGPDFGSPASGGSDTGVRGPDSAASDSGSPGSSGSESGGSASGGPGR
ncbi:hypothetical protein [Streptomyces reniochalinae]|uniref:Uncharacterized protein n=1 Tax=Streptomyces reniochalinae TaxID=2250578 RepID=A0A367F623_9ACTN|nr:hypothetical protein [Streptomyces reniochalinae]RCG25806.1 hypothetical protein DQ392_00730 [Streptomyces reniochalinae]